MLNRFTLLRKLLSLFLLPFAFCAAAQPTITSFTPASGPVGTPVTITGTGFNATAAGNIVYFGAVRAAVMSASATNLMVTVPAGATYEPLSVLNTATALTAYASKPFAATFTNPFGMSLPDNYYLPKVPFATDYAPSFVTLGDLDGDGKSDMVVSGFTGVFVFRNTSAAGSITPGSFAPRVTLASNAIIDAVVIKDLDGDGRPEIIAVSGYYNNVSITHNVSTPGSITAASFEAPVKFNIPGGSSPSASAVAVGDLNGDGKPELVTLSNGVASLSVFRNTTTPGILDASSFAARQDVPTLASPNAVAISDLDGDGKPDLATANQELGANGPGNVSVLRNMTATGSTAFSFAPRVDFAVGSNFRALAVGDIDGDGKPDLVTRSGSAVSVLRNVASAGNLSTSSFSPKVDFAFPGSGLLALADVDGDGKPDVAATGSNLLTVLRNTASPGSIGAASFAAAMNFAANNAGTGIAVGDLDGDGSADVAITENSNYSASVLRVNAASLTTAPVISFVSSTAGAVGTSVTILGSGFNSATAGNIVYFGAVKAVVTSASSGNLTVTVPAGASYQPISVLNTANGLTGYASKAFSTTFSNPYSTGIPYNFYSPKVDFTTGTLPYFVALGDLDGDGKSDMVVANASAGTISVLRNVTTSGVGAGSFVAKVDFLVGTDPRAVAIADVDGDGKLDIVVANSGSSSLSVLRNVSTPGNISPASFAAKIDFTTGSHPFSVAIGDVDADGKPDLVSANLSAGTVSVLRNMVTTGTITAASFAPKTDFPAGSSPRFVALADVDGDARPDLAVANEQSNTASVLRNTAATGSITAASFAAPLSFATGNNPNFVAGTDIDGDGMPDLVTVNYGSNTVSVLRNTLNPGGVGLNPGAFAPKVDFATGPQPFFAAISDLDGNGKPDIAVVNAASTNISVLRNLSSAYSLNASSFSPKVDFAAGNYPVAIAAGDLDGNGIAELVAVDAATNRVSAYAFNSPQAIRIFSVSPSSGPVGSTVTISGDGFDFTPAFNQVFFGAVKAEVTGGNTTTLQAKVPAGATYAPVSVTRTNTELTAYSPLPFVNTFTNPFGSGIPANFYRPRVDVPLIGAFTYGVAFGDLNLDGKPDLLTVNEQSNTLSISRNISTTGSLAPASFAAPVNFETAGAPRVVAFADIDGYFYPDVIVLSPSSYTISVFRNTFNYLNIDFNALYPRVDFPTGGYASSFAVGDLDGDGRPEIVLTNPYSNGVTVLRNQSSHPGIPMAAFATGVSFAAGNFPRSVALSDVNGDGKRDIIVANEQGNTVSVLLNKAVQGSINGSSFAAGVEFAAGSNPPAIAVGDLDGDGKPDMVTANYASNTISVLRNISTFGMGSAAQFAPKVDFATGNNPYSISIGDADGDGKPDIITANSNANTLSVLRNLSTVGSIAAGSFAAKVDFTTGGYPLSIALGDLDGDGVAELASANAASGASAISVFKVANPVPVTAAAAPAGMQTASTEQPVMAMQVFPNPTRGEFVLRLQGEKTGIMNIEVLDERGKTIEKRALNVAGKPAQSALGLSLHNRPAGVYYVKATGMQGVQVVKIVVQR